VDERYHARDRRVAGAFTQSVHGDMHTLHPSFDGFKDVGDSQVIVVVRMEVKMQGWIAFNHFAAEPSCLIGIEYAQCIGKHEAPDRFIFQPIHHPEHILFGITHAIGPVLEVEIDRQPHALCRGNGFSHVCQVFLHRLAQLIGTMFQ